MPTRRIRPTVFLAALTMLALLVFAAGASAAITSTQITSPLDGSYYLEDTSAPGAEVTISGTTVGVGELEIRCYSGPEFSVEVAEVEEAEIKGGKFSVKVPVEELGEAPCVLRAVPASDTAPLPPGATTPFEGPRVAFSEFGPIKDAASSTFTGYSLEARTLSAIYEIDAAGTCGLGPTTLVSSPSLSEGAELFRCAGALYGQPAAASRPNIQVDGHNAYDPYAADAIWNRVKPSNTPLGQVTVEKTFDRASGLKSLHETEPLVECEGKTTAFPETSESCEKFVLAGVTLERTWTPTADGRLISMSDVWRSTGSAHTVSALYVNEFGSDMTAPGTYEFPAGVQAFAATKTGQTANLTAGEGAILYRQDGAAEEALGSTHPVGAIVFGASPTGPALVTAGSAETKGSNALQMPYSFELKAAGTHKLTMAFAQGYTLAEVCALAEQAESGCQPSVTISAPTSGTKVTSASITVSGTASDHVALEAVTVNGKAVSVAGGAWSTKIALTPGPNTITALATDHAGLTRRATTSVTYTPTPPSFGIEAIQKIEGEASYTTAELSGKIGQTVDYQIVVRNTGGGSLEFASLTDAGCTSITPSGPQTLASGESRSYSCSHLLADAGNYGDEASIEGNEGTGKRSSNRVTVEVHPESHAPTPESHPSGEFKTETGTPAPTPKATASRVGAPKLVKGNLTIVIACTGPAGTSCALRTTLSTVENLHNGRPSALAASGHSRTVTVGVASASITSGSKQTITIKLNATGRALLAHFHRLPFHLAVLQQGVSGAAALVFGQNLTIIVKHG